MAGHSHWAGIKHKKGRQDNLRSKIFSKISREITVAAKLGDKDPDMNPRLRTAIQAAKQANMPKDNIARAISKSEIKDGKNFENLRYEGFGPYNVAFIIETLTDNKNRSASCIRTVLQKKGGRLGESGSTSYLFNNFGIIHFDRKKYKDEDVFELATNFGAKDCLHFDDYHEVICTKEHFYSVKSMFETKFKDFLYSGIEWRAINNLSLTKVQSQKTLEIFENLNELEDVQNVYTNTKLKGILS